MNWPNELGGSHPIAAWGNKLLRACKANSLMTGVGYNLRRTAAGTVIQAGAGGNAGKLNPFTIIQKSDWLTFEVSPGYVITDGNAFVPADTSDDSTEFELDSGELNVWFYVDLTTSPQIVIANSAPAWGVDIIPIGWVDTFTYSASSKSVINQFTKDHIFTPCSSYSE